jgi:hypothetical protein
LFFALRLKKRKDEKEKNIYYADDTTTIEKLTAITSGKSDRTFEREREKKIRKQTLGMGDLWYFSLL